MQCRKLAHGARHKFRVASCLKGGFLFMNISMAFSSSGSTITSVSQSASPSAAPAAPRTGHSSSESPSWVPDPRNDRVKTNQLESHNRVVEKLLLDGFNHLSEIYPIKHIQNTSFFSTIHQDFIQQIKKNISQCNFVIILNLNKSPNNNPCTVKGVCCDWT